MGLGVAQQAHLDLAAQRPALHERLVVVGKGQFECGVQIVGRGDWADTERRPEARGLRKCWVSAGVGHLVAHRRRIGLPPCMQDDHRLYAWNPCCGGQHVEKRLIHTRGRGCNVGAHVGHSHGLAEALHGAVLTPRTVQDGEYQINIGALATIKAYQLCDVAPCGHEGDGVPLARPRTIPADRDPDHLMQRRVDGVGHRRGRSDRDVMLAAPAAPEDGNPHPVGAGG